VTPSRSAPWRLVLAGALLSSAAASCGSKNDSGPAAPIVGGPTATVTGVVIGSSGNGLPLANVTVTASPSAGGTATSNSFGVFTLTIPANTTVAIGGSLAGFAVHSSTVQLAAGETRAIPMVLATVGATQTVFANAGGKVTDPVSKTAITLPVGYVTGTSTAQVQVTGLDPTSFQVLAMPGTFAAVGQFGSSVSLEPFAIAEIRIGDGAGGTFPLAQPAVVELHLPGALASDPRAGMGSTVPCVRYDPADGLWKHFAGGQVVASSVDGQPAVRVTVSSLSWIAAGFLNGSNSCVSGAVMSGLNPVAGATVQAYPGGTDISDGAGGFQVPVPPGALVRVVATRPGVGTIEIGSVSSVGGKLGAGCTSADVSLTGGGAPPTFSVQAQIRHEKVFPGVPVDAATVRIFSNTSPPVPLNGALVTLSSPVHSWVLPLLSNGVYGRTSWGTSFTLDAGYTHTLGIDLEPDGVVDATAQVLMPGKPVILAPDGVNDVGATFVASWSDPEASGGTYTARYIGSVESESFGTFPAIFALKPPAGSDTIGTGVGQPEYAMPNDPLIAGQYVFRLWATNGPVRYPVGNTVQFATPNIVSTRMLGYFSAVAKADSIRFNSIGDALP